MAAISQTAEDLAKEWEDLLADVEWTPVPQPKRMLWEANDVVAIANIENAAIKLRAYRLFDGRYMFDNGDFRIAMGIETVKERIEAWKLLEAYASQSM